MNFGILVDRFRSTLPLFLLVVVGHLILQPLFSRSRRRDPAVTRIDFGDPREIPQGILVGHHLRLESNCVCQTRLHLEIYKSFLCGPHPPEYINWPACNCPDPPPTEEEGATCRHEIALMGCSSRELVRTLWEDSLNF